MQRQLKGMVVVITGASAGIGRALSVRLSGLGADLVLAARRSDLLARLNQDLGADHLCVTTDVSNPEACAELVHAAERRFGRIDTLVCNAGYGFHRAVAETDVESMLRIFRTNVLGTTECIRAALPAMRRQPPRQGWRGQMMIVSSVVARRALPYFGAYSATKAAQLSLAESLRVELMDDRIAVTSVHPIGTQTEFGAVSAARSGGRRPKRVPGEIQQSAQTVAQSMVGGIRRPRPEIWPFPPARWGVGLATLLPGIVDQVMSRRREIPGDTPAP